MHHAGRADSRESHGTTREAPQSPPPLSSARARKTPTLTSAVVAVRRRAPPPSPPQSPPPETALVLEPEEEERGRRKGSSRRQVAGCGEGERCAHEVVQVQVAASQFCAGHARDDGQRRTYNTNCVRDEKTRRKLGLRMSVHREGVGVVVARRALVPLRLVRLGR